jgi:hypothetical protein
VAQVRNWGASRGSGRYLCFLDCDVTVPEGYFDRLVALFDRKVAEALGCELGIPDDPHWSERVWWQLTVSTGDRYCKYLNSGNFAITRAMFDAVGGFPEDFETAEDTEICVRILAQGGRIYQSDELFGVHLGNPKSVAAFFRRMRWHGLGISDGRRVQLHHRATIMLLVNLGLLAGAGVLLAAVPSIPLAVRVALAVACVLAVPVATYLFRAREARRWPNPLLALALIEVLYAARTSAFVTAVWRVARARLRPRVTLEREAAQRP